MKNKFGEKNANWKGGKIRSGHGYWLIKKNNHPRSNINGYVFEQILVAERMLDRPLKLEERIQHIDGNGLNNEEENLYVLENASKHMKLHSQLEKVSFELVKKGIIKFNRERGEYFATMEKMRND